MWDRAWGKAGDGKHRSSIGKAPQRRASLVCESLEGRELLAASLAPISALTVPATLGYQVPLDGSGATGNQTFTVTSSNPDVKATIAQGKFVTFNVTHASDPGTTDGFAGPVTLQLFNDLTPQTATTIENFVSQGFYNGKTLFRVASGFPDAKSFIIQGGSPTNSATSTPSGLPGTLFADEFNPQLAFTGSFQLAMANSGPDTNDTQFFITTGSPRMLDFHHTIYGQVVAGQNIVQAMTKVTLSGTTPTNPITITTATLSNTSPNGVVHIDATTALPGETATITVTATDPTNNSTAKQSFQVNAVANTQIERPYVDPVPNMAVGQNQVDVFRIPAVSPTPNDPLSYVVQGGFSTTTSQFTPIQNASATVDQTSGIVRITPNAGFTGPISVLVGVRDQTLRGTSTNLNDPSNYQWHTFTLTVNSSTVAVPLAPIGVPQTVSTATNAPVTVTLQGDNTNPGTTSALTYSIVTPPSHGTISQFNAATGTFVYKPATDFKGADRLQFVVMATGGGLATPLTSVPSTVTINVAPIPPVTVNTGAVRQIGAVLVVTPLPRTDHGTNTIVISQSNDPLVEANDVIQVTVNGVLDTLQPLVSALDRIVAYGAKASDHITIDPSVTVPAVTLDGGHGGTNVLQAGSTSTREHGWFGRNTLIGGTGPNQLVGRAGHVKFKPTATTNEIFAGVHHTTTHRRHPLPPGGTFFKFVNGKLIPLTWHQALKNTSTNGIGQSQSTGATH